MNHLFIENKKWCVLLLLAIMFSGISKSGIAGEKLSVDKFVGTWNGKGQLFGMEAEFRMTWEWVLKNQFIQLSFRNSFKDTEGRERELNAQAFYKPVDENKFKGYWFDSRSMMLPLAANIEDSVLTTLWGSPETEEGKTVYKLAGDGLLDVSDYILKNGQWNEFGQAIYNRVD